ncbi:hypothetical protein RVIR1_05140 [Candidatus Rickettsiella viridis]|uniref:Uncharacterized protein n=1 Tax=Candidatus Rickettsiella viridis TaxID=676208 RepID=A0A2Z5UU19_9COXI|nr:hypothetical protein RVIR1_05140 [Candidatus Rickettsiella viridis]
MREKIFAQNFTKKHNLQLDPAVKPRDDVLGQAVKPLVKPEDGGRGTTTLW